MKKIILIVLKTINIILFIWWIVKPNVASGLYCYPKIVDTIDNIILLTLILTLVLTIILSITHSTKIYKNITYILLIIVYLIPTLLILNKISIENNNRIPFNECWETKKR